MSKMSKNKKAAQSELRRLMSAQKLKSGGVVATKRVESPLASYSPRGALVCNVCRAEVGGGEALWPAHIASKQHLSEVNSRKPAGRKRYETVDMSDVEDFRERVSKRKGLEMPHPSTLQPPKKLKGILKNNPAPSESVTTPSEMSDADIVAVKSSLHAAIPPPKTTEVSDPGVRLASRNGDKPRGLGGDDPLPEGFFDDPQQDAKARNVEYRDPAEEEWTKFRREMKEQTEASAQIIADDQDEATAERQIDEIDEQMRNWGRVVELEQRVEEARKQVKTGCDGESSPDEMDFDEFPDWRRKKAYTH